MITKIFEILDAYTRMFVMVVQFEEIDKDLCHEIGIAPGFKIVNRFDGRHVDCFAGYKFDPDNSFYEPKNQTTKFYPDGTINSFSILLSETGDIKTLPNTINVQAVRSFWIATFRGDFVSSGIMEILEEYDSREVRKCIYQWGNSYHIAIIDIINNEIVYDVGSQDAERSIMEFLWIPSTEASIVELESIALSPFDIVMIRPTF